MKKWLIGSAAVAGAGVLATIGFLVAMGVDYRNQEAAGVEPGYTPDVILGGFQIGLWLSGVGIAALIVSGVVAAIRHRGAGDAPSPSAH